jgi:hypothetical protein
MEFFLLTIFKKDYPFGFFFFLDGLAAISLIPDTEFIMEPIRRLSEVDNGNINTTSHLIKASGASQAGAK